MEAKHDVIELYKFEIFELNNFNATKLKQVMADFTSNTTKVMQHKRVKLLPIVDPNLGLELL